MVDKTAGRAAWRGFVVTLVLDGALVGAGAWSDAHHVSTSDNDITGFYAATVAFPASYLTVPLPLHLAQYGAPGWTDTVAGYGQWVITNAALMAVIVWAYVALPRWLATLRKHQ